MTATQKQQILAHLQGGRTITPLEALRLYGCFRLGARIWDLRRAGYEIASRTVKVEGGSHVAQYWMKNGGGRSPE